jgi:hypothetical protein
MARRVAAQTHRGFNTGAVASAATLTTCPVCGETPAVAKGEKRHQVLEAHIMAQHRPETPVLGSTAAMRTRPGDWTSMRLCTVTPTSGFVRSAAII